MSNQNTNTNWHWTYKIDRNKHYYEKNKDSYKRDFGIWGIIPCSLVGCLSVLFFLIFIALLVIIIIIPGSGGHNNPPLTIVRVILPAGTLNGTQPTTVIFDSLDISESAINGSNWGNPDLMFGVNNTVVNNKYCSTGDGGFLVTVCKDLNNDSHCDTAIDTELISISFCNYCLNYSSTNCTLPNGDNQCCDWEVSETIPFCTQVDITAISNRAFRSYNNNFDLFYINFSPYDMLVNMTEFSPGEYDAIKLPNDGLEAAFSSVRAEAFLHKFRLPDDILNLVFGEVGSIRKKNIDGQTNVEKMIGHFNWEIVFSMFMAWNKSEQIVNGSSVENSDVLIPATTLGIWDWKDSRWKQLGYRYFNLSPFPGNYGQAASSPQDGQTVRGMPLQGFEYVYNLNGTSLLDLLDDNGQHDNSLWIAWGIDSSFLYTNQVATIVIDYTRVCFKQVAAIEPLPLRYPLTPPFSNQENSILSPPGQSTPIPAPTSPPSPFGLDFLLHDNLLTLNPKSDLKSVNFLPDASRLCVTYHTPNETSLNETSGSYYNSTTYNEFPLEMTFRFNISYYLEGIHLRNVVNTLFDGITSNLFKISILAETSLLDQMNNIELYELNFSDSINLNFMPWHWLRFNSFQHLQPRINMCLLVVDLFNPLDRSSKSCNGIDIYDKMFENYPNDPTNGLYIDDVYSFLPTIPFDLSNPSSTILEIRIKASFFPKELDPAIIDVLLSNLVVCINPIGQ